MNCGRPVQNVAPPVQNMAPALPMNWFKFIVYFQLFFVVFVMAVNIVLCVTGLRYGSNASMVYLYYGDLRILDILYSVLCLFFAGLAIFVQQWLIRYKRNAWVLYLFYIGMTNVVNLLYLIVTNIILGQSLAHLAGNVVGVLLVPVIYIPLNYVYFNKRKHLFVN